MDNANYDLAEEWVQLITQIHTLSQTKVATHESEGKENKTPKLMVHKVYILEFCQRLKKGKRKHFENPHTIYNIFSCG